jgi:PleD family two-component response regulator
VKKLKKPMKKPSKTSVIPQKTPSKPAVEKAKPKAVLNVSEQRKTLSPAPKTEAVAQPLKTQKIETASPMTKNPKSAEASLVQTKPVLKSPRARPDEDIPLDIEEKEELLEEEKRNLSKALEEEDDALDTSFVPTDTSERYILVVDEEGKRRNETVTIISQILPNAIIEVADDPEEAAEIMQDCDFDTYVVNFLMPGYSASPFVKAVANHPDHPLLLGFAADKISDAVDPKKGLKIIPLKRLFDLDTAAGENSGGEAAES